ncbi:hypothetical protein BCR34DRAFT_631024 [Clohesyomyces aquaticus]|uniref:Fe2OG dioxygenase domain-containing protein n=1 Tax=Clohesyomyces aquaticus TaxID=1231657 RepID=A0A1Y1ZBJ0_9PLEO|nr:hypothetical protein BCR34DRAFT_631024 [Clohesyomyces aquaticus]
MMNLLDLISQNQPHFQTHQALLVIGLQNDFILPDGKLPVDTTNGFLDRIHQVIPKFRQLQASVIWIQTVYGSDLTVDNPALGDGDAHVLGALVDFSGLNPASSDDESEGPKAAPKDPVPPTTPSRSSRPGRRALDLIAKYSARRRTRTASDQPANEQPAIEQPDLPEFDEELCLLQASRNGAVCLPKTPGAEFAVCMQPEIGLSDTIVRTSNYSAFQGSSLLQILRAKLVTELFICGCITNVSVLATVIDAARHGIKMNVIQDCLGFRVQSRHDDALRKMVRFFSTKMITSKEILNQDLNAPTHQATSSKAAYQDLASPATEINGRPRTLSDASIAESRATTDTKLSDEQFAEKISQGARIRGANANAESEDPLPATAKPKLVKNRIVMRPRRDRDKKDQVKDKSEPKEGKKQRGAPPPVEPAPRPPTIVKAESSDRLRESPSRQQRLKSSVSQPSLPHSTPEAKEKTSRVRLALASLSSRSESSKAQPSQPPKSPKSPGKVLVEPSEAQTRQTTATLATDSDSSKMSKKLQSLATFATLGPGDRIGEGDSHIIYDFFPPELRHPTDRSKPLKDLIFTQLYNEVRWQKMHHQQGEVPRLVCCQGAFGADGSMPVYRHPTDQVLPLLHFSPKVKVIQKQAEKLVGHPLNHVLIQLYRSGQDYISEHSDKTLDIVRGSSIVNVSFGAQRTMRLRTKKSANNEDHGKASAEPGVRTTERVAMPHNSMFVLGLETNKKWLHGINPDKRLPVERSEEEKAYSGIRISLTFRHIGTFLDAESSRIWGQGATSKDHNDACDVINDDDTETEAMIRAFSKENHSPDFDWNAHYGAGFDVLHFRTPPDDLPILFCSNNGVENTMLTIFLAESKIPHLVSSPPILEPLYEIDRQVCYRDNDINHTEILIAVPILLYLDHYHPLDRDDRGRACSSRSYETFVMVSAMLKYWVNRQVPTYYNDFVNMLESLEERYQNMDGPFIAGRRFSIGDCCTWPAVDELVRNWEGWSEERFPGLTEYYKSLWKKKGSVRACREGLAGVRKEDVA